MTRPSGRGTTVQAAHLSCTRSRSVQRQGIQLYRTDYCIVRSCDLCVRRVCAAATPARRGGGQGQGAGVCRRGRARGERRETESARARAGRARPTDSEDTRQKKSKGRRHLYFAVFTRASRAGRRERLAFTGARLCPTKAPSLRPRLAAPPPPTATEESHPRAESQHASTYLSRAGRRRARRAR